MVGKELANYGFVLNQLKEKIRSAQLRTVLIVNNELFKIYWEVGNIITEQEFNEGWGAKVIDQLSSDLKIEFPNLKGLSPRNLRYMRDFSKAYPRFLILQQAAANLENTNNQYDIILQQAAAKLPWGHHQVILDKLKKFEERCFYIEKCVQNNWSRDVLAHQIESGLINRQGSLTHNFTQTLPYYQSDLAVQIFKDPYHFDFMILGEDAKERDLEDALLNYITKFLLELGEGFAFMGRQKRFEAGGKEFFIDLLFYHTKLRRHIIIELKIGEFEPEYVSKMNVYLGLVDDTLKGKLDDSSIGLILCKTKNKIVAEYALRDTKKPIGIAEYKIAQLLPENIKGELPSIEEIEQKLDEEIKVHSSPSENRLEKLKEKLKELSREELKTPVNFQLVSTIFSTGLRPLYQKILEELSRLDEQFVTKTFAWLLPQGSYYENIEDVEKLLLTEEYLKSNSAEITFRYRLFGFKKAGIDAFDMWLELRVNFQTYWFEFTILNYNNQLPIVKKLYHQNIEKNDIEFIATTVYNILMDDIENKIENLTKKDN